MERRVKRVEREGEGGKDRGREQKERREGKGKITERKEEH